MRLLSSIFLIGLLVGSLSAGTVSGTISLTKGKGTKRIAVEKYTGKISGKVTLPPALIAGVWLSQKDLKAPANPKAQSLNQKNYQFGKSLIVVSKGTAVSFPNEDSDYHNIYSLSKAKRFDLGRYRKNEKPAPQVTFDKVGLVELRCEIHEHMQARLLVVDSPYFAATDTDGKFKLTNIPAGTYTLHAQLNSKTKWEATVVVTSKGITKVDLPSKK